MSNVSDESICGARKVYSPQCDIEYAPPGWEPPAGTVIIEATCAKPVDHLAGGMWDLHETADGSYEWPDRPIPISCFVVED